MKINPIEMPAQTPEQARQEIVDQAFEQVHGHRPKNGSERVIRFSFRWEIKQVDRNVIEVHIPTGGTQPIVNPRWAEMVHMTDKQIEDAECFILRQVAIMPE